MKNGNVLGPFRRSHSIASRDARLSVAIVRVGLRTGTMRGSLMNVRRCVVDYGGMPLGKRTIFSLSALAFLAVACLSCGGAGQDVGAPASEAGVDTRVNVFASIEPLADVVERIGGLRVRVGVLVKAGQDHHTFEPTPKQMAAMADARLYFEVGTLPFEGALVGRLSELAPDVNVVDVSKGVRLRAIEEHGDEHGHAEHAGEHGMGADPHIWLGPEELRVIAANVAEGLASAFPEYAEEFQHNLGTFVEALSAVDADVRKRLEPHKGKAVFVFHPAFGYFTDAYGLRQKAVEIQGKSPTPKQIQDIIEEAKAENARVLFVQPQYDKKSAEAVADAIGGTVIEADPLAKDVLKNLEDIAIKTEQALTAQGNSHGT